MVRRHLKRIPRKVWIMKGIVTLTLAAGAFNHDLAVPVALFGNFIWLWVVPEASPPSEGL